MRGETELEQLFYLVIARLVHLFLHTMLIAYEEISVLFKNVLLFHEVYDFGGRGVGLCALVAEDDDLFAHFKDAHHVLVDDLVHYVIASLRIS